MGNGIASTWSVFSSAKAHQKSPIDSHYVFGVREKELYTSYGLIFATAASQVLSFGRVITFISAADHEHIY